MSNETSVPPAVLSEYALQPGSIAVLSGGNINLSYAVTDSESNQYVLQKLSRIFSTEIHADIDAVTRHLADKGMPTPRLVPNRQTALFTEHEGDVWRLLTRVAGNTVPAVQDTNTAREAGAVLARFHRALVDLDYEFRNTRPGVHDLNRHLGNLDQAVEHQRGHARYGDIAPLAGEIQALASDLSDLPFTTERKVHGDPKITNILFDPASGKGLCLIDLDTLGNLPLPLELGDAFRSWCNPAGEDTTATGFSLTLFEAAVAGYAGAGHDFILREEWQSILPATYRICLELAARFCADALNESYFNWDPSRFASRSKHNEIRARGQLQAAKSLRSQYDKAEGIVERIFG